MENNEIENKNQIELFNLIKKQYKRNVTFVDKVSDLLGICSTAVYRRVRGDKPISLEETVKLCKEYKISFDMLIEGKNINMFDCIYQPIDLTIPNKYQNYILTFSNYFEKLRTSGNLNILMSATDIPVFHLISHKELTFFKLYTWDHSVYNYEGSFDDFMEKFDSPEIINCYQKIDHNHELVPSTEIWTETTINSTLRLINYYFEIGMFLNKDLPVSLCKQVLEILDKLQKWAKNSSKSNSTTPFQLYVSEMELENTYCLMKQSETINCISKLFTINHLNILDKEFCKEAENWLTRLSQRSIPLSGGAEKERIKFFSSQRQKVQSLIEKIEADV